MPFSAGSVIGVSHFRYITGMGLPARCLRKTFRCCCLKWMPICQQLPANPRWPGPKTGIIRVIRSKLPPCPVLPVQALTICGTWIHTILLNIFQKMPLNTGAMLTCTSVGLNMLPGTLFMHVSGTNFYAISDWLLNRNLSKN